jgi:hypothetical protein
MKAHECYHCKQWVEEDEAHDCWTTTEAALTKDLSEDLQDAYARLREAAVELGEQRIYASHHSIMFSRKACHFFVKPKRNHLEFWVFLGRPIKAPQIKKVVESSKVKRAHLIHIRHRDEVEAPLTAWMREAYELQDSLTARPPKKSPKKAAKKKAPQTKPKKKRSKA